LKVRLIEHAYEPVFQIITVNCWLDQTWNDTHLTWNASDFGGITTIGLPYDRVWRPDIILYNK
jgi:hypothetical protein